nr:VTT domain-containing protein [uncultured Roseateles sp.]
MSPLMHKRRLQRRLILLGLCLLALLGLALAWSSTPLREALDPAKLLAQLQARGQSMGPLLTIAFFSLAVSLAVPLSLLTLLMIAALGPLQGALASVAGALIGAALSHGAGSLLGHEALCRLAGPRVQQLSQSLGERGLLAVITLRLLPVAPFAVVNMVAGATHIRLSDMLLGTLIGILPSTLVMAFFLDTILQAIQHPGPLTWALLAGALLLLGGAMTLVRRWMKRQSQEPR